MDERITTQHPEPGKSGVNISKGKYDQIREAILDSLRTNGEITFKGLTDDGTTRLSGKFDRSIPWYVTTVKLDLEARQIIQRVPDSSPQRLCLI